MARTEGRVAMPERRWYCRCGTLTRVTSTRRTDLTKHCTEQRLVLRKAEHIAMQQLPPIVLNIIIIFLIFITPRYIVSVEVVVDNTSLSTEPINNIRLPITKTQHFPTLPLDQHHHYIGLI